MSKVRVTKIFRYDSAHALRGYDGFCKNIHGHTYELQVTVVGEPITDKSDMKLGMVIDFGDLKQIVKDQIVDKLDHAIVLRDDVDIDFDNVDAEMFGRRELVPYQPTAENMVVDFAHRILSNLPDYVKLHHVRLYETPTSYAEWYAEDN